MPGELEFGIRRGGGQFDRRWRAGIWASQEVLLRIISRSGEDDEGSDLGTLYTCVHTSAACYTHLSSWTATSLTENLMIVIEGRACVCQSLSICWMFNAQMTVLEALLYVKWEYYMLSDNMATGRVASIKDWSLLNPLLGREWIYKQTDGKTFANKRNRDKSKQSRRQNR